MASYFTPTAWLRALPLAALLLAGTASAQNCAVRDENLRGSYVGGCVAGWAQGSGVAAGRDRYEGEFLGGHLHGRGTYTYADGQRYEGRFVNGVLSGPARYHYTSGDVLEGEFRGGRLQGVGRLTRVNGQSMNVEWRGGTLVAVAQPAATTTTIPTAQTAPADPQQPAMAAQGWQPTMDLQDLFPSFILATATRQAPPQTASRSAAPRGEHLTREFLRPREAPAATARMASIHKQATYRGDPWGLVGVRVRTERAGAKVAVRVAIDDVIDTTDETFELGAPGEYVLYPKLRYRWERLRTVAQPMPVTVNWSVAIDGVGAGSASRVVRLRATQDVPWAVTGERGDEFLGWVFAAFVTEDAPWIDTLIGDAFQGVPVQALGYQRGELDVIKQVAVVYQYLRKRGVKYSSITTGSGSGASQRVQSQVVRFPSESIKTSQANCVDGTVLMASILRKIGIDAYIVTGPGHAMLGFLGTRGVSGQEALKHFFVVETTAIGDADFDVAFKAGNKTFKTWMKDHSDDLMFDIISVSAMRRAGVMPIAR
jgi:hypothetical protein